MPESAARSSSSGASEPAGSETAVVLLSGGLDSATALAVARRDGFRCITIAFDYGQRHRHELMAARAVSAALGAAEHFVCPIDLRAFGGSALTSAIEVPKDRDESQMGEGIPVTYVPARNLVFLSLALGLAEVRGARDLFIGVNAVDYSGYPDCRPEFIESFAKTASLATKIGVEAAEKDRREEGEHGRDARATRVRSGVARGGIRVHAPLIHLTKAEIIRLGNTLGVDYVLTHSCYDPLERDGQVLACGRCDSCQLRRSGFAKAGVADPTRYA